MRHLLSIFAVTAIAAACETTTPGYTYVGKVSAKEHESEYQRGTLRWTDGNQSYAYFRRFARDGKLAFCGFRVSEPTAVMDDLAEKWFDLAYLTIDGEKVASLFFLESAPRGAGPSNATAGCVVTELSASPALLQGKLDWIGESEISIYY